MYGLPPFEEFACNRERATLPLPLPQPLADIDSQVAALGIAYNAIYYGAPPGSLSPPHEISIAAAEDFGSVALNSSDKIDCDSPLSLSCGRINGNSAYRKGTRIRARDRASRGLSFKEIGESLPIYNVDCYIFHVRVYTAARASLSFSRYQVIAYCDTCVRLYMLIVIIGICGVY